jgi:hypothetical protein
MGTGSRDRGGISLWTRRYLGGEDYVFLLFVMDFLLSFFRFQFIHLFHNHSLLVDPVAFIGIKHGILRIYVRKTMCRIFILCNRYARVEMERRKGKLSMNIEKIQKVKKNRIASPVLRRIARDRNILPGLGQEDR